MRKQESCNIFSPGPSLAGPDYELPKLNIRCSESGQSEVVK